MKTSAAVASVHHCLEAIDTWNGAVNAMITVDREGALEAARAADERATRGHGSGLLQGVSIVVKDNIDTVGLRTTYGSPFFRDHVPNEDALVVRRLRDAGAIILGKATLHEFAFGVRSFNPIVGQCLNPWDLRRIPGGSSGGSAVALATGMAEMALGTETGASIRIPAALNGVCGLRPTPARISNAGVFPMSPSHDVVGPMARRVSDIARLFEAIRNPGHPMVMPQAVQPWLSRSLQEERLDGLRIGRPKNYYYDHLEPDVERALDVALGVIEGLGAQIVDLEIPDVEDVADSFTTLLLCDGCHVHQERLHEESAWEPQTLDRMRRGLEYSGVDYARALHQREIWQKSLGVVFEHVDVLLTPASSMVAPLVEDERDLFQISRDLSRNAMPGSFGQIPGLAIPCGFSSSGLPVGLQLEAKQWDEALLFRVGSAFQAVTDWHTRAPSTPEVGESN